MTASATLAETDAETEWAPNEGLHTNVYVVLDFSIPPHKIVDNVYGPFRSHNAAKDWGLASSQSFTVMEIMRPVGVEDVGFVDTTSKEPTLEDQGIHPDQTQIGDYIDPNIGRG